MRLMFSLRSLSLKPKSLFSPNRMLSPSSLYAARPRCRRCCSSAIAMVDFPEAERPVNQRVKPCCLRRVLRSCVVTADECHVMFLGGGEWGKRGIVGYGEANLRCHYGGYNALFLFELGGKRSAGGIWQRLLPTEGIAQRRAIACSKRY